MPMTKTPAQPAAKALRTPRWGDRGVSERMVVQDDTDSVTPLGSRKRLQETGILSELQHHVYGTATITHGTGTNAKDAFGPYPLFQQYALTAGANTPLISLGYIGMGLLQQVEYPDRTSEANAIPASVMQPLADVTNLFNHPAATGTLRMWNRIPVALRWLGMPGGAVGYLILQNKRISNVWTAKYGVSGSSPYSLAGATAGAAPYDVTGNDTVTGNLTIETWETLHTVPDARSKMPVFGFTRYLQQIDDSYSGTSYKYLFEPGGLLLRCISMFLDGGTTPVTDADISQHIFSYGTNKQVDVYTPYRNRLQQENWYGRMLSAGTMALDFYTASRNTVDAKSTENTANVQLQTVFAQGYTPAANSTVHHLLDKVYIVQNRLG